MNILFFVELAKLSSKLSLRLPPCIKNIFHTFQITYVILINCGATIDVVELLEPEEHVVFFILDSHRPYDICNIYNEKQVQIIGAPTADEDIPKYEDVFNDESVSIVECRIQFIYAR